MRKQFITFGEDEGGRHKFNHRKSLILLEDVDIKKIQVSKTVSSVEKMVYIFLVKKMKIIKLKHYV